ncbi:alpha/beta hydrolase family protein [Limisphaera sp. VF-2]|uniref:alpha/beta hydrolase family protein n=1 Tax=Limisphaera sp. VF-2 TaxID=3400418 RepID=UPI00175600BC
MCRADRTERPLLIAQGSNDPRVKQRESEQTVAAIQKTAAGPAACCIPDGGHDFARPENRVDSRARRTVPGRTSGSCSLGQAQGFRQVRAGATHWPA